MVVSVGVQPGDRGNCRPQGRTIQSWLTYSSHHMHSMYLFYSIQMQKEVCLRVFNAWKFQSIECKSGLKSQIFFSYKKTLSMQK